MVKESEKIKRIDMLRFYSILYNFLAIITFGLVWFTTNLDPISVLIVGFGWLFLGISAIMDQLNA